MRPSAPPVRIRAAMQPPVIETVRLAIAEGGAFPARRVFCVGRNNAEHAREMGHDAREAPFFFGKDAMAWTQAEAGPFPPRTDDLHREAELVVALGDEVAMA